MAGSIQERSNARVTIVVLTRNAERYIERNLSSAIAQDYEPKEVWVVDGESSDKTVKIARKYAHRIITTGPGFSTAREAARRLSKAQYIFFMDSDKYAEDQLVLSKLVSSLEADPRLGASQAILRIDQESMKSSILARAEEFRYHRNFSKVAGRHVDFVVTSATVFRSSALGDVGGFELAPQVSDDSYISMKLSVRGYSLLVHESAVVLHRLDEGLCEYLAKAYRGGKGYFMAWKTCGKKASTYMLGSTPAHALVRGIKMAGAALIDEKDVFLAGFLLIQVTSYYTTFFIGFVAELVLNSLTRGST